jgi:ubiquinone/menaquinone biosynthesis C-methylase UbiE
MKNISKQKAYWDKVAGYKNFTTPVCMELLRKYLRSDSRILDFGCGQGRILQQLKDEGFYNLYGVDISKNMIEIAGKNLPRMDLKVTTDVTIPYNDSAFDCVIIAAVLTCIISSDEQKKLIAEIKRVLKPEGFVYINDFLINDDRRNVGRYEKYEKKYGIYGVFEIEEGVAMRHHNPAWICELTSSFKELLFEEKTYTTMNGHTSKGFCFIGTK